MATVSSPHFAAGNEHHRAKWQTFGPPYRLVVPCLLNQVSVTGKSLYRKTTAVRMTKGGITDLTAYRLCKEFKTGPFQTLWFVWEEPSPVLISSECQDDTCSDANLVVAAADLGRLCWCPSAACWARALPYRHQFVFISAVTPTATSTHRQERVHGEVLTTGGQKSVLGCFL